MAKLTAATLKEFTTELTKLLEKYEITDVYQVLIDIDYEHDKATVMAEVYAGLVPGNWSVERKIELFRGGLR